MTALVSLIARLATPRGIVCLIVAYAVVFGAILLTLAQLDSVTGGAGILDFDVGYSRDRVMEVFGSYGEGGMALYRRIQVLDLFNPALYSLLAAVFTYLLWRDRGPDWLCLLPLLGGIGDYAENFTLFLLSRSFPALPDGLVSVSSALSLAKNTALVLGLLPLVVGLVLWGMQALRRANR